MCTQYARRAYECLVHIVKHTVCVVKGKKEQRVDRGVGWDTFVFYSRTPVIKMIYFVPICVQNNGSMFYKKRRKKNCPINAVINTDNRQFFIRYERWNFSRAR